MKWVLCLLVLKEFRELNSYLFMRGEMIKEFIVENVELGNINIF